MARARFQNTVHSGLLAVAAATAAIALVAINSGQAAFAATTKFTLKNLSASVDGTSVTTTATVAASVKTTAQIAGICVRDSAGNNYDMNKSTNVVLTTSGTVITGPAKAFPVGTFTYWACLYINRTWYQAGSTQTFTVSDSGTGTGGTGGTGGGSGSGTNTPPPGSSYGNNALAQWNTALTNRATAPVTWVAWGDSITEGQGSSTLQGRWIDQTLGSLRTQYPTPGVTGGIGYLPSYFATYGPDSTWTSYSSEGGNIYDDVWGSLGVRMADLGTGAYETYTVNGTSADIMYTKAGGTFTYKVDSGPTTSVDTAGTYDAAQRVHVTFPSAGTHTLTITSTSGTVYFEGIMVYNGDENKGIRLYEAAHSGASTDDFMGSVQDEAEITAATNPDLVTIELGGNDYMHGPATPSQVTSNLQTMISDIRADSTAHEPSIVLVIPQDISAIPSFNGSYTWQQYIDAIRAVANADPSVGILDLTSFGTAGTPGGLFSSTDGLHPSDTGQTKMAGMVESYLEDE